MIRTIFIATKSNYLQLKQAHPILFLDIKVERSTQKVGSVRQRIIFFLYVPPPSQDTFEEKVTQLYSGFGHEQIVRMV